VEYLKEEKGPNLYSAHGNPDTTNLFIDEVIKQLEKTLLLVLKNANVKEIRTFTSWFADMEEAVKNVLAKKPDAAKILKVVKP
jgi:truncated hemoglobin YjbI